MVNGKQVGRTNAFNMGICSISITKRQSNSNHKQFESTLFRKFVQSRRDIPAPQLVILIISHLQACSQYQKANNFNPVIRHIATANPKRTIMTPTETRPNKPAHRQLRLLVRRLLSTFDHASLREKDLRRLGSALIRNGVVVS